MPGEESAYEPEVEAKQAEYRHANSEDEARIQAEYETVRENDEEDIDSRRHADSEDEARILANFETNDNIEDEVNGGYRRADSEDETRIEVEFLNETGGELLWEESEVGLGSV